MKTLKNPALQYNPAYVPRMLSEDVTCAPCYRAKLKAAPHRSKLHDYSPGEAFSSDVAGPLNFEGERLREAYFVTGVDAASRFAFCIPIQKRTQVLDFVHESLQHYTRIFNKPPLIFVSDNAKEYISSDMSKLLSHYDVQHFPRTVYQEQENGIAERINQTLMNAVRSALYTAQLQPSYWSYDLKDAVDKYNQLHHQAIGMSPHMAFYGQPCSDIDGIYIFGQIGYCPNLKAKPKLYPKGMMVRYLHREPPSHIRVEKIGGGEMRIRRSDFHPYHIESDPAQVSKALFHTNADTVFPIEQHFPNSKKDKHVHFGPGTKTFDGSAMTSKYAQYRPIPKVITTHTPPPRHHNEALRYPDKDKWLQAIDKEL